jgi:hypothetical protein
MPKRATRKGVTPAKRSPKRKPKPPRAAKPVPAPAPTKATSADPAGNGGRGRGRPSLYQPEYCKAIVEFFAFKDVTAKVVGEGKAAIVIKDVPELPTFASFADSIGVHRQTLHEWCDAHPEFSDAYARARDRLERMLWKHGLTGDYSPSMAQFFLKTRLGVVEKVAVIGGNPDEGDRPVQVSHEIPPDVKDAMSRLSLRAKAFGSSKPK